MKRLLFVNLLILLTCWMGNAQFLSKEEANEVAIDFVRKKSPRFRSDKSIGLELVYVGKDTITREGLRSVETDLYYIFNVNVQEGFVIVSGDERTPDILGYSFESPFVVENLPENIRYWLDNYRHQLSDLRTMQVEPDTVQSSKGDEEVLISLATSVGDSSLWERILPASPEKNSSRASFATRISPLIRTKWNQDAPFYNLCPLDAGKRSLTGCVATALAQIMKYHEWPVKGTGRKSYVTESKKFSVQADFGSTFYDWDHMKNVYTPGSYTEREAEAVAVLMKQAGVASEMNYTNRESGAYHYVAGQGVIAYFGYNPFMQLYRKDFFTNNQWINLLKGQLNAGLPLYYGGSGPTGGHAFVCDGYDERDLFHINWGWGGLCDGYFEVNRLKPYSPGMEENRDYSDNQTVFCDVRKPYSGAKPTYILNLDPVYSQLTIKTTTQSPISRNGIFNVAIQYYNTGLNLFEGEVCVGLVTDSKVYVLGRIAVNHSPTWGMQSQPFNDLKIPSSISTGSYKIYAFYKHKSEAQWRYMTAKQGYPMYIDVSVTPTQIIFNGKEGEQNVSFSVEKKVTATQALYQNGTASFSATLKNKGKATYKGRFGVCLISSSDTGNSQVLLSSSSYSVAPGITQSYTVTGKITVPPGAYTVYPVFEKEGGTYYLNEGTEMTVYEAKSGFKLAVEEPFYSYDNSIEKGEKVSFYGTVKNIGDTEYRDYLGLYLVKQGNEKENQILKTSGKRIISPGKSLFFSVEDRVNLNPGIYTAYMTYQKDGKMYYLPDNYSSFTIFSPTANESIYKENIKLYLDPESNILFINGQEREMKQVDIYNLSGKWVKSRKIANETETCISMDSYPPGGYLVVIRGGNGVVYRGKFLKK